MTETAVGVLVWAQGGEHRLGVAAVEEEGVAMPVEEPGIQPDKGPRGVAIRGGYHRSLPPSLSDSRACAVLGVGLPTPSPSLPAYRMNGDNGLSPTPARWCARACRVRATARGAARARGVPS